jgi:plastocyanin
LVIAALATLLVAGSAGAIDQTITFPTAVTAGPYTPADVTIERGERVTFNGSFANHPLVWDAATFDPQSTGSSAVYAFAQPGLFRFHCMIHLSMVGSVQVNGNALATPDFTWSPASPQAGQAVTFTPTGFTDPDGSIARYEWDLDGDGAFEVAGAPASRTYSAAGAVTARLRYVDDRGETSPATAHGFTVRAAGGGSGGGGPSPGQQGGAGGSGSPIQPGGTGSPSAPNGTDQGAGKGDAGTTAPRLGIAARALAFRDGRARAALTVSRPATLTATLKRRGGAVLATGRATARRAGTITMTLRLTADGARALRRGSALRATLTVIARPRAKGAKATTATKTLSVRS